MTGVQPAHGFAYSGYQFAPQYYSGAYNLAGVQPASAFSYGNYQLTPGVPNTTGVQPASGMQYSIQWGPHPGTGVAPPPAGGLIGPDVIGTLLKTLLERCLSGSGGGAAAGGLTECRSGFCSMPAWQRQTPNSTISTRQSRPLPPRTIGPCRPRRVSRPLHCLRHPNATSRKAGAAGRPRRTTAGLGVGRHPGQG